MALGVFGSAFFYLLVYILKENSLHFLVPLGFVAGLASGCYWVGNNLSSYILTQEKTRNLFFSRLNLVASFGALSGPILGGFIIQMATGLGSTNYGYSLTFLFSSIILFYVSWITRDLPQHSGINFSLSHILGHRRLGSWKIVLTQQFLYGLWDVAFNNLSSVIIFLILGSEFKLGFLNFTKTLASAIFGILAGNLLQKNKDWYRPAIFLSPLGLFIFALFPNYFGIFSLVFVVGFFQPFLNIASGKAIYDVMDRDKESWRQKYHYLIERDSALGLGRIITYLILLTFFINADQIKVAQNWLIMVPVLPLLIGLLQVRLNQKIYK